MPRNDRSRTAWWGVVLATLVGAHASAAPEASFTTLMQIKQDARDGTAYTTLPAYTAINLNARKLRLARRLDVDVVVSSWGRMDGNTPLNTRFLNGDVSLAYIETRGKLGDGRVGRQLVFDGVARGAHLDGISARSMAWHGLSVAAFAGVPVVPLLDDHRGRFIAGGRASWRHSWNTEIGVSGVHVLEHGRQAHQHVGIDGRVQPFKRVTVAGMLRWSTLQGSAAVLGLAPRRSDVLRSNVGPALEKRFLEPAALLLRAWPPLAEADFSVSWQPVDMFLVSGVYRRTAPALFIPRSSIFSVFSAEQRDQLGATFAATPIRAILVDGDAAVLVMPAGIGVQAGTRGAVRFGPGYGSTLGLQSRVLKVPGNGYLSGRAFGSQKLPLGITSTIDADLYLLEQRVHGQRFTAMVAWTNGIMVVPGWDVSAQVAAGSSPLATARVEGLLRVSYRGGARP